jgi:hypothetical protein
MIAQAFARIAAPATKDRGEIGSSNTASDLLMAPGRPHTRGAAARALSVHNGDRFT